VVSDDRFVVCLPVSAGVRGGSDFEVRQFQDFEDVLTVLVSFDRDAIDINPGRGSVTMSERVLCLACLPVLNYPPDVIDAMENGEVTRQEAAQLARLTPERLDVKPKKALAIRQEVLSNHTKMQGSQAQLRRRMAELVGDETIMTSENMAAAAGGDSGSLRSAAPRSFYGRIWIRLWSKKITLWSNWHECL